MARQICGVDVDTWPEPFYGSEGQGFESLRAHTMISPRLARVGGFFFALECSNSGKTGTPSANSAGSGRFS